MERTLKDVQIIANEHGWRLNPNEKAVEKIIGRQNMLKQMYGEFYCPCKKERTKDNICPCKDSPKEIAETTHCHCNLFYKK